MKRAKCGSHPLSGRPAEFRTRGFGIWPHARQDRAPEAYTTGLWLCHEADSTRLPLHKYPRHDAPALRCSPTVASRPARALRPRSGRRESGAPGPHDPRGPDSRALPTVLHFPRLFPHPPTHAPSMHARMSRLGGLKMFARRCTDLRLVPAYVSHSRSSKSERELLNYFVLEQVGNGLRMVPLVLSSLSS